jgi:iron complex outermembrane receptor protein
MKTFYTHTAAWLAAVAFTVPVGLAAQEDSIPRFRLGEIEVRVARDVATSSFTSERIELREIESRDAASVSEIARLIPGAHVQTNSRGETLIYLRNAAERQVGVFFNGALLNVPWDYRVDLSLVPSSVVGGIEVVQGVPPVEYGTNVVGGAVNLTTRDLATDGRITEAIGQFGSNSRMHGSLAHRAASGRFNYSAAVAYSSTDGMALPEGADLAFNQIDDRTRTNTDSRIANLFGSGDYTFESGARLGFSLLHVDAEKGVAPEGHVDDARFWRYPQWQSTTGIVSGEGPVGLGGHWKSAAWVSGFDQVIDAYGSATYDTVQERQDSDDLTMGARAVLTQYAGPGTIKFAVNGLTSSHKQRDLQLEPSGEPTAGETFSELEFRQHTMSVGAEYTLGIGDRLAVTAGGSFDAMFTPKTGDKPDQGPFTDYSVTMGARYTPDDGWFVRSAVGRKSRFPTMRELYGEALNRFLVNPDLQPESSILAEIGAGVDNPQWGFQLVPFGSFTSNTIDQRSVEVPGEERPRRQRINLAGSRVLGLELSGRGQPIPELEFEGSIALMDVHRNTESPDEPDRLSEKPQALARLAAGYRHTEGPSLIVETLYTGHAYSLNDSNEFVPLERSFVMNIRLGQTVYASARRSIEFFIRMDNVADEVIEPQLGLPGAGRHAAGGIKASF